MAMKSIERRVEEITNGHNYCCVGRDELILQMREVVAQAEAETKYWQDKLSSEIKEIKERHAAELARYRQEQHEIDRKHREHDIAMAKAAAFEEAAKALEVEAKQSDYNDAPSRASTWLCAARLIRQLATVKIDKATQVAVDYELERLQAMDGDKDEGLSTTYPGQFRTVVTP